MAQEGMSVEAQVDLLMRGTRFADEADYWGAEMPEGGELRSRMQAELRDKLRLGRPLRVYLGTWCPCRSCAGFRTWATRWSS